MATAFPFPLPSRSDAVLAGVYWLVVGPVLLLQYRADTGWPLSHLLALVGVTTAFDTLTVALVVGGLLPLLLSRRFGLELALLPAFVVGSGSAYRGLYAWVLDQQVSWSAASVILAAVAHAKSYGLLAVLLTGTRYYEAQRRVLRLQKAQAEGELRALQAQLDPHFLFNNLHVLQVLIGHDSAVAEEFLHRFANLYRYLLRHRATDFVPLAEELVFLDEYVFLLRHRFGAAYQFAITLAPGLDPAQQYVVPGTVQLLLENAIKHNCGDEDDPLLIAVAVDAATLSVYNARRPKPPVPGDSTGLGLASLRQRYHLLAGTPVQVEADAHTFLVRVPLLRYLPTPVSPATTRPAPAHAPAHFGG